MITRNGGENVVLIPGQLFKLNDKKYLYVARRGEERLCFNCYKRKYEILKRNDLEEGELIKFMEKCTWVLYKPNHFYMVSPIQDYINKFNGFKNKTNIYAVFKAETPEVAAEFKKYWLDDNRNFRWVNKNAEN